MLLSTIKEEHRSLSSDKDFELCTTMRIISIPPRRTWRAAYMTQHGTPRRAAHPKPLLLSRRHHSLRLKSTNPIKPARHSRRARAGWAGRIKPWPALPWGSKMKKKKRDTREDWIREEGAREITRVSFTVNGCLFTSKAALWSWAGTRDRLKCSEPGKHWHFIWCFKSVKYILMLLIIDAKHPFGVSSTQCCSQTVAKGQHCQGRRESAVAICGQGGRELHLHEHQYEMCRTLQ